MTLKVGDQCTASCGPGYVSVMPVTYTCDPSLRFVLTTEAGANPAPLVCVEAACTTMEGTCMVDNPMAGIYDFPYFRDAMWTNTAVKRYSDPLITGEISLITEVTVQLPSGACDARYAKGHLQRAGVGRMLAGDTSSASDPIKRGDQTLINCDEVSGYETHNDAVKTPDGGELPFWKIARASGHMNDDALTQAYSAATANNCLIAPPFRIPAGQSCETVAFSGVSAGGTAPPCSSAFSGDKPIYYMQGRVQGDAIGGSRTAFGMRGYDDCQYLKATGGAADLCWGPIVDANDLRSQDRCAAKNLPADPTTLPVCKFKNYEAGAVSATTPGSEPDCTAAGCCWISGTCRHRPFHFPEECYKPVDKSSLSFTHQCAFISLNGQPFGQIISPHFPFVCKPRLCTITDTQKENFYGWITPDPADTTGSPTMKNVLSPAAQIACTSMQIGDTCSAPCNANDAWSGATEVYNCVMYDPGSGSAPTARSERGENDEECTGTETIGGNVRDKATGDTKHGMCCSKAGCLVEAGTMLADTSKANPNGCDEMAAEDGGAGCTATCQSGHENTVGAEMVAFECFQKFIWDTALVNLAHSKDAPKTYKVE